MWAFSISGLCKDGYFAFPEEPAEEQALESETLSSAQEEGIKVQIDSTSPDEQFSLSKEAFCPLLPPVPETFTPKEAMPKSTTFEEADVELRKMGNTWDVQGRWVTIFNPNYVYVFDNSKVKKKN